MKKVLLLVVCALLWACNPGQGTIDSLEKLTSRIENNSSNWTEADWDDAAQNYSEIIETLQRYEYTDEQLQHIGQLEGRCMAGFTKHYSGQVIDIIHDASVEMMGVLEGFSSGFDFE